MTLLKEMKFVCIDCETTGLDAKKDQIIEVAAVQFSLEETFDQFDSLIDPKCEIPEASIAIHKIKQEMVAGKPTIDQVLPKVIEMIGPYPIVGHGVQFDIDLLIYAADRLGISVPFRNNLVVNTLKLARIYGKSPSNSLEMLRKHFHIDYEGAHRALSDVLVNIEVFRCLARDYRTKSQLIKSLSKPALLKKMPLGKHKGREFKEIPGDYLKQFLRMSYDKDFDEDLLFSIRSELKQRKGKRSFGQAGNPFADLGGGK